MHKAKQRVSCPAGFTTATELKNTKRLKEASALGKRCFIEVNIDQAENKYLVIHTGSRNLASGGRILSRYMELCGGKEEYYKQRERLIEEYKMLGRRKT